MNDQSFKGGTLAGILQVADDFAEAPGSPDYALRSMRAARLFHSGAPLEGEGVAGETRRIGKKEAAIGDCIAPLANEPIGFEFRSQVEDLETRLIGILADPSSEFAKQFPESANWRLRESEKNDFADLAAFVTRHRRRRSQRKWDEGNSEARRDWKADNPEKLARYNRGWKSRNPERLAAQRDRAKEIAYHKPFVAIDFEGQDYEGDDIKYNGATWRDHRIFLGGAGGWRRAHDPNELAKIGDDERRKALMREGEALSFDWLGDASKRPLTTRETFDWLLSLPGKFGAAVFAMFAFNYDVTQILYDLPRGAAWEIAKRETFPDQSKGERKGRPIREAPTFWREYAVKYLKSKKFELWRLRDPDKPWKPVLGKDGLPVIDPETGREKRQLDASAHIVIYDAFGFYQEPFVKACESLVLNGYMGEADLETIRQQKANRSNFAETEFETIKHYCGLELVALSKAMTVLRDGFDLMGLRLRAWSGAGSAASAAFRREGVHKEHFPADIATEAATLPRWQDAAHHAFFGGRIELLRQGYLPREGDTTRLWGYDIASAYPSACVDLPSTRDGTWSHVEKAVFLKNDGLERLKAIVANANVLSMFCVQWAFPIDRKPARRRQPAKPFPFFPLPYRMGRGAILFPSAGKAWIMRDELLGALEWIETFFPSETARRAIPVFMVREQWLFSPANDEKPFAFIRDLYALRAKTPKTDTLNKAIKLVINSLYGKTAQSVGGSRGKAPATACPYYAAAITANCRMRLMLAALRAPFDIVMFATDGIVSTRPLEGLPRVRDIDAKEKADLGDWEMGRLCGGFYLQSGVYLQFTPDAKIKSKTRGMSPREMLLTMTMEEFLIEGVLEQWRKPFDAEDVSTHPRLEVRHREFVTIGSAVANPARFRVRGRWAVTSRFVDIHNLGVKRELIRVFGPLYLSGGERSRELSDGELIELATMTGQSLGDVRAAYASGEALRCRMLVPTMPAENPTPTILSAPRMPDWIDEETGEDIENEKDLAEIAIAEAA